MLRLTEVKLPLDHPESEIEAAILARLKIGADELAGYSIFRRGVDARKTAAMVFIYTLDVAVKDQAALLKRLQGERHVSITPDTSYKLVTKAPATLTRRPVVIGFGPCGLFAGLILAQMGFRPIILERGKAVRERTKDTWDLWRKSVLNPESNVQFGEGGAGTFSVGTFRLVAMVERMRATIQGLGGEIRFERKVADIDIETGGGQMPGQVRGAVLADGEYIATDHVVLAVGHSARDTFQMLHDRGVYVEAKAFSIGFRIEHPQLLIDRARFGNNAGHRLLGAADYKLAHHCRNGRSVYSFCMCPGGTVVAAASEPGGVVTNGMSQYSRNERNANAGIVVGITPEDYPGHALAGIAFQRHWEARAFEAGGNNYCAPAQLVGDFIAGRPSTAPGSVLPSYTPGVRMTNLSSCVPDYAVEAIREALPAFDKQIKGFAMDDAVLTGVETRTSSPIRITRNQEYQSLNTRGLFPAGEGAGYAGGILSAAVDGIEVAQAVALSMVGKATARDALCREG